MAAEPDKILKPSGDQPSSPKPTAFDPEAEARFVKLVMQHVPKALEELKRRIAMVPRLLAYLNAKRGRPMSDDDLDDVSQEVFKVIWMRLGDYRPIAPLESWMAGICENQLLEAIRKKQKHASTGPLELDPVAHDASPEQGILDAAEARQLLTSLGAMETKVLTLKHFEGRTFTEIAALLGISVGTAKTLHYRAVARLRAMYDQERRQREEDA